MSRDAANVMQPAPAVRHDAGALVGTVRPAVIADPRPAWWLHRAARVALSPTSSTVALAVALAAVAVAYRLVLLRTALGTVDSDQAVLGIMARHILHGEHPVFFYGQEYQGALEAYLTAGVFVLWGQSDLTLRLVPVLFSALLVVQLYGLARRLYGPRIAAATSLWLAVPAPVLVFWGTAAGAGYIEVMAVGCALVIIAVRRWGLGRPRCYDLPVLGLLSGLGIWIHPVIAYYFGALALTLAPRAWRRLRLGLREQPGRRLRGALRHTWPALALFVVGASPWLGYTLLHPGASFSVLSGHPDLLSLPGTVGRLALETLPVLFGGTLPATLSGDFVGYANGHIVPYALTLLAVGYVVVRLAVSPGGLPAQLRAVWKGRPLADAPLALLPLVTLAFYLASRFEALPWTTHNPRYLLPLYTSAPYLLACAVPVRTRAAVRRWARRGRGLWAAPGRVYARLVASRAVTRRERGQLIHSTVGTRGVSPQVHAYRVVPAREDVGARPAQPRPAGPPRTYRVAPARGARGSVRARLRSRMSEVRRLYREGLRVMAQLPLALALAIALAVNIYGAAHYQAPPRIVPLAAGLLARGDGAVYGEYWLAWRLAFESGERLTPIVTRGLAVDPQPNTNRYPPYLAQATRARRWAYILPYDVGVPELVALLRRLHVPYTRWRWGNASVFDGPVRPSFPPKLAAGSGNGQR